MKYKKTLLASLLSLISLSVVGCGPTQEVVDDKHTMFCNFENGKQDLNTAILVNNFGRASLNTVPKFVKEGKGSALIEPTGIPATGDKPLIYFPLSSNLYNFNKGNLTLYDSLSFWIYNDSDDELEAQVGFIADVVSVDKVSTTKISAFTMKPHQWNEYNFNIDHAYCNLFFDIKQASAVYFEFNYSFTKDPAFAPKLYLDELKFANAETPHIISDDFVLDENEICDFEKDFQKYFLGCSNAFEDALTFNIVEDVDGIKASQGKKFLCIDVKAGHSATWADWSSLFLTEQYMRKTKLKQFDLPEEASSYRLAYDIRFVGTKSIDLNRAVTQFFTRGQTKSALIVPVIDENLPTERDNIVAPMNEWCTLGFTFCKQYEYAGANYCIDTNFTGVNTGRFDFSIGNAGYDYKILVDNIRLIKLA